jgi:hypothetical protein
MERIDAARLEALAENCRCQAEQCLEIVDGLEGAPKRDWFFVATKWIELAQQVEAMRPPTECAELAHGDRRHAPSSLSRRSPLWTR